MPAPRFVSHFRRLRTSSHVVPLGLACLFAFLLVAPRSVAMAGEETEGRTARPVDEKAQAAELIQAFKSKDPDVRAEALEQAVANPHPSLTSPLLRVLSNPDAATRMLAMDALATRTDKSSRRKAASALNPRLKRLGKHPAEREELMTVIATLQKLEQPSSIRPLIDGIHNDMELEEVTARVQAVAAVPDPEAIDRLIQFLAKGRRGNVGKQRAAAERALQRATGERLGRDPDKWRAWWRENKKDFDFDAVAAEREDAERQKKEKEERRAARKKEREERKKGGRKGKPKDQTAPKGPTD